MNCEEPIYSLQPAVVLMKLYERTACGGGGTLLIKRLQLLEIDLNRIPDLGS